MRAAEEGQPAGEGVLVAQLGRPVLGAGSGAAASSCEVSSLPGRDAVAPFRVTPAATHLLREENPVRSGL